MKEQQIFITDDGERFDTREEAKTHEAMLKNAASVDRFISESGAKERRHGEYKRIILAWEAWKNAEEASDPNGSPA